MFKDTTSSILLSPHLVLSCTELWSILASAFAGLLEFKMVMCSYPTYLYSIPSSHGISLQNCETWESDLTRLYKTQFAFHSIHWTSRLMKEGSRRWWSWIHHETRRRENNPPKTSSIEILFACRFLRSPCNLLPEHHNSFICWRQLG